MKYEIPMYVHLAFT